MIIHADFRLDSGEWRRQAPGSHSDTFRAARGWRTPGARATSGASRAPAWILPARRAARVAARSAPRATPRTPRIRLSEGARSRPRASAAPRVDAGGRPAGGAEGAGDDAFSRAPATSRRGRRGRRWRPGSAGRRCPGVELARARTTPTAAACVRVRGCSPSSARCRADRDRRGARARRGQRDRGGVARGAGRRGRASAAGQAPDPMAVPRWARATLSVPGGDGVLVETERCALLASAESATSPRLRAARSCVVGGRASKSPKTRLTRRPTVSGDAYAPYAHLARRRAPCARGAARRGAATRGFGGPF